MGITCKPIKKVESIMQKMENELERQKKLNKEKKKEGEKN
jgi:hypothetical protein